MSVARRWGPPLALLGLGLLGWEGAVRAWADPLLVGRVFPTPGGIAAAAWTKAGTLAAHAAVTLGEVALGLALALLLGGATALAVFASRTLARALYPLIVLTQNVPVFAIAPLLVIWMGFGIWPKVVVAALVAFFPIVVGAVDGLRAAEAEFARLFWILGASRWQRLVHLELPGALPLAFSGLKVGATLCVVGAVVGEWVGAEAGLGHLMLREKRLLNVDTVFAAVAWLTALALGLFGLVAWAERRALRWKRAGTAPYNARRGGFS